MWTHESNRNVARIKLLAHLEQPREIKRLYYTLKYNEAGPRPAKCITWLIMKIFFFFLFDVTRLLTRHEILTKILIILPPIILFIG